MAPAKKADVGAKKRTGRESAVESEPCCRAVFQSKRMRDTGRIAKCGGRGSGIMHALEKLGAMGLAGWFLWELWRALTQGSIHSCGALIHREKNPVSFWLNVGFCVYGSVIVLANLN